MFPSSIPSPGFRSSHSTRPPARATHVPSTPTDDRIEKKAHLTGRHDVDQGWLKDVRTVAENGTAPLIVPRFMFHGWLLEDYQVLFAEQALVNQLIALLVRECVYVPLFSITFFILYLFSTYTKFF
jgi:hypothetical protein